MHEIYIILQYQVTIHRNICLTPLRVFLVGGEDVEIIIVNDGSSDDTSKIAHEYEAKISDDHQGGG